MDETITADAGGEARDRPKGLLSARVDNTLIHERDGRKLGSVYTFHIVPETGQVAYAVLSLGGFLGLGQSYHPIPFGLLRFDQAHGGYVVEVDKQVLQGSPNYRPDSAPLWDAAYARRITDYYGEPSTGASF